MAISKLQHYSQKNILKRALQEYGRLVKTIFILKYLHNEDYRRRIQSQLNKGEALHSLRRFIMFANEATIRRKTEEQQGFQAACLTLVTNAIIVWNTVYMERVIQQLRLEGHAISNEDIAHTAPTRHRQINPYGRYNFENHSAWGVGHYRPLKPAVEVR